MNKSFWQKGNTVGMFLGVLFIICFAWRYIHPVEVDLHMGLFHLSYFWFDGMSFWSFISGLVQSYIWGYIGVGAWYLVGGHK